MTSQLWHTDISTCACCAESALVYTISLTMDEDTRSESDELSLDLSYTSSEYDVESSNDGESNSAEKSSQLGVVPYQFEPYASE